MDDSAEVGHDLEDQEAQDPTARLRQVGKRLRERPKPTEEEMRRWEQQESAYWLA